jgi:hypothetical protein
LLPNGIRRPAVHARAWCTTPAGRNPRVIFDIRAVIGKRVAVAAGAVLNLV